MRQRPRWRMADDRSIGRFALRNIIFLRNSEAAKIGGVNSVSLTESSSLRVARGVIYRTNSRLVAVLHTSFASGQVTWLRRRLFVHFLSIILLERHSLCCPFVAANQDRRRGRGGHRRRTPGTEAGVVPIVARPRPPPSEEGGRRLRRLRIRGGRERRWVTISR